MSHGRRIRHLPALHLPDPSPGVLDADLIARWVVHRDEAAFELLVRRYAPTVLAACRRLLADPNDADDAFQAAFLVLARKAGSITRSEVLVGWLHRVAVRAALRVRAGRLKQMARHEPRAIEQLPAPPPTDPAWAELLQVLDEEVERLPTRHRVVFVLCCLEGKTGEEAGRLLGCPPGTVSSRLTRARERLRDRLTRRGFAPAALVLATLTGDACAMTVPNVLIASVMRTVPAFAVRWSPGGPPTRPATIAEGVVKAMLVNKLKMISALLVAVLLAAGAVIAGVGSDNNGNRNPDPDAPRPAPKGVADVKAAPDNRPPAAPVVRLVKAQPGGLDRITTQQCIAEAGRQTHLFPTVAGTLKRMDADIGERVKAGQLLAEIDAPVLALDERQAVVGLEQSRGLLKEAEARVATAKVEVEAMKGVVKLRLAEVDSAKSSLDLRKTQHDRLKELFKQKVVGVEVIEGAESQLRVALSQVVAAEAGADNAKIDVGVRQSKLDQAVAGVATAQANVEAAKVGLERARLAIVQTRITAPFDGVIAARGCQAGDFVRPGDRSDPAPLFTVMRADVLRFVVWVPERDVARFEPGLAAEVTIDAFPDVTASAKVARVGFAVEPQFRTVRAEIELPNPKGNIRPGMTGSVSVKLGKGPTDAVRVPVGAVVKVTPAKQGDPAAAVYVYKDGKARLTPVRVGYQNGTEAEVTGGLTGDDQVVTNPKDLALNAEVTVEVEKAAPPK